jgi:hypothetical protein
MNEPVNPGIPPRFDAPWVKEVGIFRHRWKSVEETGSLLTLERIIEATTYDDVYKGLQPAESNEYRQRLVVSEDNAGSEQNQSSQAGSYSVKLVDGIPMNPVSSPSRFERVVLQQDFRQLSGAISLVSEFINPKYIGHSGSNKTHPVGIVKPLSKKPLSQISEPRKLVNQAEKVLEKIGCKVRTDFDDANLLLSVDVADSDCIDIVEMVLDELEWHSSFCYRESEDEFEEYEESYVGEFIQNVAPTTEGENV